MLKRTKPKEERKYRIRERKKAMSRLTLSEMDRYKLVPRANQSDCRFPG
jgi:hypothetical protein